MKRNVKVVGLTHKVGEKRNGDRYDIHILNAVYEDTDTVGSCVFSSVIPAYDVPLCKVGDEIMVISHFSGGREYIDAIFPNP